MKGDKLNFEELIKFVEELLDKTDHARPVHDAHVPDLDARDAPEQRRVRLGVAVALASDEHDGREALRDERVEDVSPHAAQRAPQRARLAGEVHGDRGLLPERGRDARAAAVDGVEVRRARQRRVSAIGRRA